MIKIIRTKPYPEILNNDGGDKFELETSSVKSQYLQSPLNCKNGSIKISFQGKVYGNRRVKEKLIRDQFSKCAFCEDTITSSSHGDVEHYRPKGGWIQKAKIELSWLLLACL